MKKVVIFGAAGLTGKYITRKMQSEQNIEVSAFVRNPLKFDNMDVSDVNIIKGDALNLNDVKMAMDNQDIVICSLEGDVLTMAKNIVTALPKTTVKRIIWITGMGIHGEIKGFRGFVLKQLAKSRPEYIKAADTIAASTAVTTLLRCGGIKDGNNEKYRLTKEGEQPRGMGMGVDRAAIAKCIADMIVDDTLGKNDSLGITN
jgi:hypothetical protein